MRPVGSQKREDDEAATVDLPSEKATGKADAIMAADVAHDRCMRACSSSSSWFFCERVVMWNPPVSGCLYFWQGQWRMV